MNNTNSVSITHHVINKDTDMPLQFSDKAWQIRVKKGTSSEFLYVREERTSTGTSGAKVPYSVAHRKANPQPVKSTSTCSSCGG